MRLTYRVSRGIAAAAIRVFLRYRSEGADKVPRTGPVVLVANHCSYLDPALVGIGCRRQVRFVARANLARHRIIGWWLRAVGAVLIDRSAPARSSFTEAVEMLSLGNVVAVFPEGTRSRTGELMEFKKGVLHLVDKTRAIVVPVGIMGSFEAWPRHRKLPRLRRCSVRFGEPLTAQEVCAVDGLDRLRRAVAGLSGQALAAPTPAQDPGPGSASSSFSSSPSEPAAAAAARMGTPRSPDIPAPRSGASPATHPEA
jgi:1-acyl-sn-glycerol-3-phosphate acyltransferase